MKVTNIPRRANTGSVASFALGFPSASGVQEDGALKKHMYKVVESFVSGLRGVVRCRLLSGRRRSAERRPPLDACGPPSFNAWRCWELSQGVCSPNSLQNCTAPLREEDGWTIGSPRIAKTSRTCQPPTLTSNGSSTRKSHIFFEDAMEIPDAKAAVDKYWNKVEKKPTRLGHSRKSNTKTEVPCASANCL